MAEVTEEYVSLEDLLAISKEYQYNVVAELVQQVILKSDKAADCIKLKQDACDLEFEQDRIKALIEMIQLTNTIIADYITKEF